MTATSDNGADTGARVVLVIGATSGIGLASARRLAARGDHLVLAARSEETLEAAAGACRGARSRRIDTVRADVSQQPDVEALIARVLELHGRIDVVVLAAAVMAYGSVENLPVDIFEQVVRTSVFGTAHVARAVVPVFRRQGGGTLVVVNSLLGSVTIPKMGAYSTAKWGQRGLVRTLQQELRKDRGLRVCLVSPGSINTPIYYQAANYLGRQMRPPWPVRSPEKVAEVIERLTDHPRQHVSVPVGAVNPLIISGFRLLPFVYDGIADVALRLFSVTRETAEPGTGNVVKPQPSAERMHGHWPDPAR